MSTSTWILWILLSRLTGSPILTLLALLALGWAGDRYTFRRLPDPLRAVHRWRRAGQLRRTLLANPHDRRARLELADLVTARRPAEAVALVRPNVEAGDEDSSTLYVLGRAMARSGALDDAERVLSYAREADPHFRVGELDLELGRLRLARRDFAGARDALARLVAERPGTVEGRWLLATALAGLGDAAGAERARDEGWREYLSLPRFRRRQERRYAWRIRPARAVAFVAVAVAVVVCCAVWLWAASA
jgi:predicted Zn-dependent protease